MECVHKWQGQSKVVYMCNEVQASISISLSILYIYIYFTRINPKCFSDIRIDR